MSVPLPATLDGLLERARDASRRLPAADRDAALLAIADALERHAGSIVEANAHDLAAERARGTSPALLDRLKLDEPRIRGVAEGCRQVADRPDPLGRVLDGWQLPSGLQVRKVSVPFGVIGMIFESRPNVTVDAAALAVKAGSAAVLRGSSNALASNRALVQVMRSALAASGLPEDAVQLVDSPDRELVTALLEARGKVDLVIPRGGAGLIQHVVENARVPVIETGVGNCHVYVHAAADLAMAESIIVDAKVRRPGVCNAAETLLVDAAVADAFLPPALASLRQAGVELRGCERTRALAPELASATEADWETEFLDLTLAVRVVDGLDQALDHIARYGSQHSEAIVTGELAAAERFRREVDAAAVYVNASTRFTDGFAFGLGAEIGISTQKLHARGPMGLAEIVSYKFLIDGDGQVRG